MVTGLWSVDISRPPLWIYVVVVFNARNYHDKDITRELMKDKENSVLEIYLWENKPDSHCIIPIFYHWPGSSRQ